ncbi:hypothetical protein CPB83DRAFT_151011 [Crepidotus variabilis]|uniref:Uncharacterized protein n=1 Tax=Crepidotus variabilis TaxID=179855 RepID=A0A9P6JIJ4_9AGAR|nr:hypothetical protein CPB83DRAFT_151011 [Crepidotus variabilis]
MVVDVSNINYSQMPNPHATEALLEPSVAENSRIFGRLAVGALAIAGWDALSSFPEDLRLLTSGTFTFRKFVYVLVRVSPFAYILVTAISGNVPKPDCSFWNHLANAFYVVAHATIGLLFYFRVAAVWRDTKIVILFFRIAWVGLVVGAILVPTSLKASRIEGTDFCILLVSKPYFIVQAFTRVAYDLLVCAAVTYKLGYDGSDEQPTRGWASWFLGRQSTFRFSLLKQRLLRDSHIYFMVTALFKVVEIAVFFALKASGSYSPLQIVVTFPDIVITAILALRIFRNLKLGQPGIWAHSAIATVPQGLTFLAQNTSTTSGLEMPTSRISKQHTYPPCPNDQEVET